MCGMRKNSKQYRVSPARTHLLHSFSWSYSPAEATESSAVCRVLTSYRSVKQDAKPVLMEVGGVVCAGRWPQCCASLCEAQVVV